MPFRMKTTTRYVDILPVLWSGSGAGTGVQDMLLSYRFIDPVPAPEPDI